MNQYLSCLCNSSKPLLLIALPYTNYIHDCLTGASPTLLFLILSVTGHLASHAWLKSHSLDSNRKREGFKPQNPLNTLWLELN